MKQLLITFFLLSGLALGQNITDATKQLKNLPQAVQAQVSTHNLSVPANCIAHSGSATAYTCTTSPTFTPAVGDHIQFEADVANTGTATLAVNGAAAATIHKQGGSATIVANDLLAGHWISATFDGTYWQLEGQLGNAASTSPCTVTGVGSSSTCAFPGSVAVATSVSIAGGTPMTSQSSANSQIVTCPPGGTSTQYCGADGAWHTIGGGGTVTGVTAAAPVASSGGTAPVISMPVATTTTDGYLSHTDWNTFNGKQSALPNVTNDTQTKASVMPNTAPAAGQLPVGVNGGNSYAPVTLSGDCTLAYAGAITCTKSSGTAFASGAFAAATSIQNNGVTVTPVSGAINLIPGSNVTLTTSGDTITIASTSTASTAFSALTGSTNTSAAMVVGSGAYIAATGTGTITATSLPYSGLTGTVPTWNQNTTGTAANVTATSNSTLITASSLTTAAGGAFASGAFTTAYSLPTATNSILGGVKPDGSTLTNTSGALSVTYGTAANTAAQGNDSRITGAVQSGGALGTPTSGVITNLTGTCTTCSIGGNAASATSAITSTTATNLAGGTSSPFPYESGTNTTSFYSASGLLSAIGALSTTTAASTYAPLASPTFTGSPVVPGYLTTASASSTYAPLASPALTGTPTAPTQAITTNNTDIATTAAVTTALGSYLTTATASSTYETQSAASSLAPKASPTFTGTVTIPAGASITSPSMTPQAINCSTTCSPTAGQLSNALVSNYGQGSAAVTVTGPTLAAGMNFIMIVGTAPGSYAWKYTSTGANVYLDGGSTAYTTITFATPGVGNSLSCFSFQTGSSTYSLKCTTLAGTSAGS